MAGTTSRAALRPQAGLQTDTTTATRFAADNGGPTQTIALVAGSPAINAGSNALVPNGVTTDQRGPGYPRIALGTVDIGAYEYNEAPSAAPNSSSIAPMTTTTACAARPTAPCAKRLTPLTPP